MLIKQENALRQFSSIGKSYVRLFLLLCIGFIYSSCPQSLYGEDFTEEGIQQCAHKVLGSKQKLTLNYYLYVSDFVESFIQIPTSNATDPSSTSASSYLAGRAPLYNEFNNKSGTCSASFLCMQNDDGIYTDISNFISVDNGLIVTWFTPTKLINLELDTILHSMVTECIVVASTKVGFNPFYGMTFNLVVSSDDEKIYFSFTKR